MKQARIVISVLCLALIASLSVGVHALASGDARHDVINAEYHFAETAAATNTKEAFLSHLASNGLIVRQGALVNGIDDWKGRQPNNNALLSWYPAFVDVSPSGDFGLSTGPWEWKQSREDAPPSGFGHFVSIWRREANGEWKVAIDIGVSHHAPIQKESPLPKTDSEEKVKQQGRKWSHSFSKDQFIRIEKQFIERFTAKGRIALSAELAEDARIYRAGEIPVFGHAAKTYVLQETNEKHLFSVLDGEIAMSGDWGYVYGNVLIKSQKDGKEQETKAVYMRVWKKNNSKWQVVLEVITL